MEFKNLVITSTWENRTFLSQEKTSHRSLFLMNVNNEDTFNIIRWFCFYVTTRAPVKKLYKFHNNFVMFLLGTKCFHIKAHALFTVKQRRLWTAKTKTKKKIMKSKNNGNSCCTFAAFNICSNFFVRLDLSFSIWCTHFNLYVEIYFTCIGYRPRIP